MFWSATNPRTWRMFIARWAFALAVLVAFMLIVSLLVEPSTWVFLHSIARAFVIFGQTLVTIVARAFSDPYGA